MKGCAPVRLRGGSRAPAAVTERAKLHSWSVHAMTFKSGVFKGPIRISVLVLVVSLARSAAAQQVPTASGDPAAEAPIRIGVVAFDPHIALTNLGVDTNVFNSDVNPQSDFTFTLKPGTDIFLRTGRGLFTAAGNVEFLYFNEFDSQRAINSDVLGRYELRFDRLRPYASASWLDTRQRPGYEIDMRARHYEEDYHAGTDVRVASKSTVRFDFRHLNYRFAGEQVFNGQALNEQLDRTLRAVEVSWRQRLTALTTWVTRASREAERFEFHDLRNSDSVRISSGFELGSFALIRGSAFAGFRTMQAADGGIVPGFTGVTADVAVSYTAPSQTRLGAAVDRDIQYSYENRTPYYVQTGWTTTLTQRVTGRWDVQLSGGRDRLAYRAIVPALDARTDVMGRLGGGIGYTLGDQRRISLDANSYRRTSALPGHEYRGMRVGLSVTYGY